MLGLVKRATKKALPLAAGIAGGPAAGAVVSKLTGAEKEKQDREDQRIRAIVREEIKKALKEDRIDSAFADDPEYAAQKWCEENQEELADIARNPQEYPELLELADKLAQDKPEEKKPEEEKEEVSFADESIEAEEEPEEPEAPVEELPPGYISKHFQRIEFFRSKSAQRRGINNDTNDPKIEENLKIICENILEPTREHFGGKWMRVNSGYRSPELNAALKAAKNSQHMFGKAVDIEIMGIPNHELAQHIIDTYTFDQIILENYTLGEPNSGWVHVSYDRDKLRQRGDIKTMIWEYLPNGKKKPKYLPGIVTS